MRVSWVMIVAVLTVTGCSGKPVPRPTTQPAPRLPVVVLDADAYGAIIIDGAERVAIGVTRDGIVAWRKPVGPNAPPPVACLGRCPNPAAEQATNPDTSLVTSANGHWALAINVRLPGTAEGRWHERRDGGWQPVGAVIPLSATTACLAPDGSYALLLGQSPARLDRAGRQSPVTDLSQAGTCALASKGGIVAELSWGPQGGRSPLRVFDSEGDVTLRAEFADTVLVTADPTSDRVAYLVSGTLHEVRAATGEEIRVVSGLLAARYDRAGTLVVIRPDRSVSWIS